MGVSACGLGVRGFGVQATNNLDGSFNPLQEVEVIAIMNGGMMPHVRNPLRLNACTHRGSQSQDNAVFADEFEEHPWIRG